ncbi:hypothetical protein NECAME_12561 [Necator americanus]|uniref:Uncharacterized protein n=1 Tax=Necator americanus TaxID=51031 RepID=W2T197_NECAM|nr:hypothetical protein NECAME_12561 [Necator americanus]ETN75026.1 hypothetical protein NECAME_12561 [Necator americanus]
MMKNGTYMNMADESHHQQKKSVEKTMTMGNDKEEKFGSKPKKKQFSSYFRESPLASHWTWG